MLSAINKEMLITVGHGLGHLLQEMVFVGGAIPELYIPEGVQIAEVRQTDDVDCIIEIAGRRKYAELEQQLRDLKFEHEEKLICRWIYKEIIVDVMPTDEKILGFSNQWYGKGIPNAIEYKLEEDLSINILPLAYFVGCKLEALFNRGMSDLRLSKDLEDIVFLLNYAAQLVDDISNCESELKSFIKDRFAELRKHPTIQEAIFCVLPAGENEPDNVKQVLFIINTILTQD